MFLKMITKISFQFLLNSESKWSFDINRIFYISSEKNHYNYYHLLLIPTLKHSLIQNTISPLLRTLQLSKHVLIIISKDALQTQFFATQLFQQYLCLSLRYSTCKILEIRG